MSKHTPGPWAVDADAYPIFIYSESETWPLIDELGNEEGCKGAFIANTGDNKANARLIAAAPTILQELIRAREYIAACIHSHAETVTNPTTGLVEDPEDVLAIESDQDLLNGIDAAIARAEAA